MAKEPLYKGCPPKLTVLHFDLRMVMSKAQFGWLDASFNNLLWLLGSLLPKGKKVHVNTYWVKKLFKLVMMGFQKINACPNHYIMYRRQRFTSCSSYSTSNQRNAYVESMQMMRGPQGTEEEGQQIEW